MLFLSQIPLEARQIDCGDHINNMWVNAFVGPSRQAVLKQIDSLFDTYYEIKDKTPWQIHHQYGDQLKNIENINKSNFFMRFWGPTYHTLFSNFQEADSQTEALIAVLGILRFKADNNRPPETLEELLLDGYITYLPEDPYSEGVLLYKISGGDFRLYSVGKDFEDNGGETVVIEEDAMFEYQGMLMPGMSSPKDQPPKTIKRTVYKDIVYWPVSDIPEYVDRKIRF